jgi:hypothetical protein
MMRDIRLACGLFLALLAIGAQLTVATAMPASASSLASATVLCQHSGDTDAPRVPTHPSQDCLLCFFCHGALGPAGVLATPPLLPVPSTTVMARAVVLPPSTAPPLRVVLNARPRGPPTFA